MTARERSKQRHPARPSSEPNVAALDPAALRQLIKQTQQSLDAIVREYEWLHGSVYGGRSGALGEARSAAQFSDQTGQTAMGAAERSGRVREVSAICLHLNTLTKDLARKLRARPDIVERPDRFEPSIDPDQLQELREAKARREGRGEGWGSG